jgi:hypothetical protein
MTAPLPGNPADKSVAENAGAQDEKQLSECASNCPKKLLLFSLIRHPN